MINPYSRENIKETINRAGRIGVMVVHIMSCLLKKIIFILILTLCGILSVLNYLMLLVTPSAERNGDNFSKIWIAIVTVAQLFYFAVITAIVNRLREKSISYKRRIIKNSKGEMKKYKEYYERNVINGKYNKF